MENNVMEPKSDSNKARLMKSEPDLAYMADAKTAIIYLNMKSNRDHVPLERNTKYPEARLREGYTIDNLRAVVDFMIEDQDFLNNPQYFTCDEIFGPRFKEYLEKARTFERYEIMNVVGTEQHEMEIESLVLILDETQRDLKDKVATVKMMTKCNEELECRVLEQSQDVMRLRRRLYGALISGVDMEDRYKALVEDLRSIASGDKKLCEALTDAFRSLAKMDRKKHFIRRSIDDSDAEISVDLILPELDIKGRIIRIFVPGNPKAQARPRTFVKDGKSVTWSPKDKTWQAFLIEYIERYAQTPLLEGPLIMSLVFTLLKPKSKSKKILWPDVKPDLDNLAKTVKDVCQGIIYRNDSQICKLMVKKVYGEPSGVEIEIKEMR